jgi:hypothetical protein
MMTAWIVGEGLLYFFVVETKCLDARRHGVANNVKSFDGWICLLVVVNYTTPGTIL